jgi:hypothetical protein
MGFSEKIAKIAATLSPSKQAEVLDFVEFLASRGTGERAEVAAAADAQFRDLALRAVVDDDDPETYELKDCKEVR